MVWHDQQRTVARLYSEGCPPARRSSEPVSEADSPVIGSCPLRLRFPLYAVSTQHVWPAVLLLLARRSSLHGRRSCTSLGSRTRLLALRPHITLSAEKGNCVGLCVSCPVASSSSEISPTDSQPCLYRVPHTRFFVSFRRCTRRRASSCRVRLPAAMHALPAAP